MSTILSKIPLSFSLLILICFCLPFVTVSCERREVTKLTGINLAIGGNVKEHSVLWSKERAVPPQPVIAAALAVAGVGILASLMHGKSGSVLGIICGIAGAGCLLYFKYQMDAAALKYSRAMFSLQYQPYYWVAVGLFGANALINLVMSLPFFSGGLGRKRKRAV